jgi:hypothetical protein
MIRFDIHSLFQLVVLLIILTSVTMFISYNSNHTGLAAKIRMSCNTGFILASINIAESKMKMNPEFISQEEVADLKEFYNDFDSSKNCNLIGKRSGLTPNRIMDKIRNS